MKILLAYDGFEHSKRALEEAAELAAGGLGEMTILSVVPELTREGRSLAVTAGSHPMRTRTSRSHTATSPSSASRRR